MAKFEETQTFRSLTEGLIVRFGKKEPKNVAGLRRRMGNGSHDEIVRRTSEESTFIAARTARTISSG